MSYDKNGLGIAEMTQVAIYWPSIYDVAMSQLDSNPRVALDIVQKTIDAYNAGMIEREGN